MAHVKNFKEEECYQEDTRPSSEENLEVALNNRVQMSGDTAFAMALGPLTHHFKGFAHQKGWLPPLKLSPDPQTGQDNPSKNKAKTKRWPHIEAYGKLLASVTEDHGYSTLQDQEWDESLDPPGPPHLLILPTTIRITPPVLAKRDEPNFLQNRSPRPLGC
ncbi:hypothetical protein NDU88_007752 [Pleurodeles waltl]|uniref:Uncharacterized protein n=1 Tax=Pleurodeles waltl TaxID=8319 RepID=A0AAV7U251_PLEWA|nr:hypothetical protein NDU88_007752 [Pleurodeles waltl]